MATITQYISDLDAVVQGQITEYMGVSEETYYAPIDVSEGLTPEQTESQRVAAEVAKIGIYVCVAIFAICFIVAVTLGALAFPAAIIAIPSAIGVLVFLLPAIARIISASLEFQSKDVSDSRRIVQTVDEREADLKGNLKIEDLLSTFNDTHIDNVVPDGKLRKDLADRVKVKFPKLKPAIGDNQITFRREGA